MFQNRNGSRGSNGAANLVRSLNDTFTRRFHMPPNAGVAFTYFTLFLVAWYVILWVIRLILSVVWPMFLVATAVVVFRMLQVYEPQELTEVVNRTFVIITDTLTKVIAGTMDFCMNCFS